MKLAVDIQNTFFNIHPGAKSIAQNPGGLVSSLIPNVLMVAGIIFFVMIVFAGFSLIVGAGKDKSPQDAARARSALTYAVAGFLIVITAYFILQMVGAMLGINFTSDLPLN
jgi:uncharacterized membrane protein